VRINRWYDFALSRLPACEASKNKIKNVYSLHTAFKMNGYYFTESKNILNCWGKKTLLKYKKNDSPTHPPFSEFSESQVAKTKQHLFSRNYQTAAVERTLHITWIKILQITRTTKNICNKIFFRSIGSLFEKE
jgi:hypothetical protein